MKVPNALDMQTLKYGDRPDSEKDRLAAELRDAGRHSEALLLYDGRPEHPFVREEARWAVSEGNGFHLLAVRLLGATVTDDELRACAEAGERKGRFLDARQCYQALGDEAAIQAIAGHLPVNLQPSPEAPTSDV